jgi:formylglycine-generating enzyme required for sulfatase activity
MSHEMSRAIMLYLMSEDYEYRDPLGEDEHPVMIDDIFYAGLAANKMSSIYGLDTAYILIDSTEKPYFHRNPESNGWRLPTEAEWEYMASYGMDDFPTDDEIDAMAWHRGNSGGRIKDIGLKSPNALGLYDMLGNVSELCFDTVRTYTSDPVTDPFGQPSTASAVMVDLPARGGNVLSGYWEVRPTERRYSLPPLEVIEETGPLLGFRLVRNP